LDATGVQTQARTAHVDYLKTMAFILIAQDIHRICYVLQLGIPARKARPMLGASLGRNLLGGVWVSFRVSFSIALMSILG